MRLTKAGEYAVRCALYLAGREKEEVVNRKQIAEEMEIPDPFLAKIAQQLAHAGIIEIVQGRRGGLRLIVPPSDLTLLDVVEAAIGEIFLNDCVMRPSSCHRSPSCTVHQVWEKARNQLRNTLKEVTFADLLNKGSCINPLPSDPESEGD